MPLVNQPEQREQLAPCSTALVHRIGIERGVVCEKEEADRGQLSAGVANSVQAAKTVAELAAALDGIVDERGSPKKHPIAAGTPILQPTDERRRTGSHYTPRTLTAPIVEHALAPAFERLGPDATPEQILDLKVCDPTMGSGAFLVEACRALAAKLVQAWVRHPGKKPKNIPPEILHPMPDPIIPGSWSFFSIDFRGDDGGKCPRFGIERRRAKRCAARKEVRRVRRSPAR
jgi:hypothetical protein